MFVSIMYKLYFAQNINADSLKNRTQKENSITDNVNEIYLG